MIPIASLFVIFLISHSDGDENNDFFIGRDNGKILLAKQLDWERKSAYNLSISISDGVHEISTQLNINVIDINDHRPEFNESVYRIDISESVAEGVEILRLHAIDLDEDKTLFYSLHAAQSPVSLKQFRIDSVTGSITIAQSLDRELMAEHVLIVIVKDQGTPAKRNYAKVFINVRDHNDHTPEFTSKMIEGKVYEMAPIGSNVVTVYATDLDAGDNGRISYSIISGNIGGMFNIDSDMGTIRLAKSLSTSTTIEYMLQVKASDHGQTPLFSQVSVQIFVAMVDNAPPKFTKLEPAVEIFENIPIGTFVMQIEARSTSSLLFDIVYGNVDDTFFINPSTGIITTKDQLDYEKNKYVLYRSNLVAQLQQKSFPPLISCRRFFNLTVRATNMASAMATSSAIVHVLDRNDNVPEFTQTLYKGEISEAAPIASMIVAVNDTIKIGYGYVFTSLTLSLLLAAVVNDLVIIPFHSMPLVIKANDNDAGINSHLHFDIVEAIPRHYFHIDATTGAIKTIKLLDYESVPMFTFHVKVSADDHD